MGFLATFWNYLVLSAPYLLAGLLFSGFVHALVPMQKVKSWLGGNKIASVFRASLIGIPLPLCSCAVIPTAVTLRKSGANNGATSSFLISTPESGVDSIALTYALMDFPMTILRPLAAFFSAVFAGVLQLKFNDFKLPVQESSLKKEETKNMIKDSFKYGFGKLVDDISVWLMLGIIVGALISYFIPEDFFLKLTMEQGRFLILLIGIPLYICATASTPIALSLILKGLSPGAALLLLLVGPATNMANLAVLQKYIGKKGVLINIFSIAVVGLIFSYLTDYLYLNFLSNNFKAVLESKHEHHNWWDQLSAAVLLILLLKGIYNEKFKKYFVKEEKSCCH